jgi:hypothetical protein
VPIPCRSKSAVIAAVIVSSIAFAAPASVRAQAYSEDDQYYADVYGGTSPYYGYDFAAPYFYDHGFRRPRHEGGHGGFHEGFHGGSHGGHGR